MENCENRRSESADENVSNTSKQKACLVDEMEYKFSLPILNDGKTESYVKLSKIMLIVQATDNRHRNLVKKLKEKYKQICALLPESSSSSFSLFSLHRNSEENSEGERKQVLRGQVRQKCQNGINLVVVNSSLNLDDMRYFFYISKELGYVMLFEPWKLDENAIHRLRGTAVSNLVNGSLVNHLFFGWFLNERDSLALRQECLMYVTDCVAEIKEFESMLQRCGALSDLPLHFQFGLRALEQDLVYCALKFCGSSYVSSDKTISQLITKGVYGQVAKLKVFGFIISPFAIGAKVRLTYRQKELIDRHSNVDMCTYRERRSTFHKRAQHKSSENQACFSKCESTLEAFVGGQHDPERPYSSRAQIGIVTLGYAKPKTPGDAAHELSDAVNRELNAFTKNVDVESWLIKRSSVSRYGKYWMINLCDVLTVDAILSSEVTVK